MSNNENSNIAEILRAIINGSTDYPEFKDNPPSRIAELLMLVGNYIAALKAEIESLPDYMNPKGTLGTGPDDLPDLPDDPTVGDTYFVATAGTYDDGTPDGKAANIGDMFIFGTDNKWLYVPTGDIDTWRNIFVDGVEVQSITNRDALKFISGDNIKIEFINGEIKISFNGTLPVPTVYGFHIDSNDSDPEDAVTYLQDAAGFTPCYMDYANDKFEWGSWKDAFFMPRPCMLKPDGTVDFYLDPDDYTLRDDGITPSHVDHLGNIETSATAAAAYEIDDYLVYDSKLYKVTAAIAIGDTLVDGTNISEVANAPDVNDNAMIEWGKNGKKIYYKIVPDVGDPTSASIYVSDWPIDEDYKSWSFINHGGSEVDHFYTPCYNGSLDANGKLRSISGMAYNKLCQNKNVTQEVTAAELNNPSGAKIWYTEQYCDITLINILLILMSKSLDTQTAFGKGRCGQTSGAEYMLGTGTMDKKGLFWGSSSNNDGVKVLGMENWWGNQHRRFAGLQMNNYQQLYKMTRSMADGSSTPDYNQTGNGYLQACLGPDTSNYVSKMWFNKDGFFDYSVAGSGSSKYYCDYWYTSTGLRFAVRGGVSAGTAAACGAFCVSLNAAASNAYWAFGAAVSCKPLS